MERGSWSGKATSGRSRKLNLKTYEVTIYDDKDNLVERVTSNGMEEASRYLDEHKPENGCGTIKEVKNEISNIQGVR